MARRVPLLGPILFAVSIGVAAFGREATAQAPTGKWAIAEDFTRLGTPPWAAMPANGRLWTSRSGDAGRTWTTPAIWLDTPFIIQTKTGVVVFAVNTGMAFSYDDGRTWVAQGLVPGAAPATGHRRPSVEPKPIAATGEPHGTLKLSEILGMPRAIRIRGPRDRKLSSPVGARPITRWWPRLRPYPTAKRSSRPW
jgi:hypothetical protein